MSYTLSFIDYIHEDTHLLTLLTLLTLLIMMCCLLVLDSVTSTPQWIRQTGTRVYLKEGTYHTRRFRGPSTNDMKK